MIIIFNAGICFGLAICSFILMFVEKSKIRLIPCIYNLFGCIINLLIYRLLF